MTKLKPAILSALEFDTLTDLFSRKHHSASVKAARAVLVLGYGHTEAANMFGVVRSTVTDATTRYKQIHAQVLLAYERKPTKNK